MTGATAAVDIREVGPADREAIRSLASEGQAAPLRYLALFGHPVAGTEQAATTDRVLDGPGLHLVARDGGAVVGQVSVRPVADLADHFELPFFEVGPLLSASAPEVDRARVLRALLDAHADASLRSDPPGVVMLRVEGDDLAGLLAAEAARFRIRESSLTFVNDLERAHRNPPAEVGDVRVHRFGTDPDLPEDFVAALRGQASQVKLDHYHADPRLPDRRCDDLYERLLARALRGEGADVMVMRYLDDQLVGFGTWRRWTELEAHGVSMVGSSFGFRVQGAASGNLTDVGTYVCNHSLTGNRLLEWTTQAINFPMVNMLCRQPSIRLCRASHVLHRWTDRG